MAVFTALTLVASAAPFQATAAPAAPETARKTVWGHGTKQALPPTPNGVTRPIPNIPRAGPDTARRQNPVQPFSATDWDAGDVPWHRYSTTRLTDSTVARVDISTGNLMLASTDLDIAPAGPCRRRPPGSWTHAKAAAVVGTPKRTAVRIRLRKGPARRSPGGNLVIRRVQQSMRDRASHCLSLPFWYRLSSRSRPSSYSQVKAVFPAMGTLQISCGVGVT